VFRPGALRAAEVRPAAAAEARRQIDEARYGPQLVLPVDSIESNPRNPRRAFNDAALAQLAASMQRDGQIQPVVVRCMGDRWQLIAGERRWRAARLAGIATVAAVQREASDAAAFRLALVENLHREDLSQQEQVEALDMLATLADGRGLRQTAAELSTSPGWLSRRLSMRRDPVVFPALEEGRITFVQANELLSAPAAARRALLERVLGAERRVSFDELRGWVQASREQLRQRQQQNGDQEAPAASSGTNSELRPLPCGAPYAQLLAVVRDLDAPAMPEEIAALGDLVACLQERWELVRPRRSRGRPRLSVVPA
jgi:ParB family chromosome partitioning protein